MKFFGQVYEVVKIIPTGKVMMYGQVAKAIGTRDARRVGQALHGNKDKNVPCHRVVFADGSLVSGVCVWRRGGTRVNLKKSLVIG